MCQRCQKSLGFVAKYGRFEVQREVEPDHPRNTYSDVRVAAEITVNLNGKRIDCQNDRRARRVGLVKGGIHQGGRIIRNDHFQKEAIEGELRAGVKVFQRERSWLDDLRQKIGGSLNGPGDKMREKAHERKKIQVIFCRPQLSS